MRRHMDYFKASGKALVAYMDAGAEKEYFLALGCDEVRVRLCLLMGFVLGRVMAGNMYVGIDPHHRLTHSHTCPISTTTTTKQQIYMPPGGALRLQGFVSAANFLRGVFDKVIGLD